MSISASATLAFCFSQAPLPRRDRVGWPLNPPTYFWIRLMRAAGTCSVAFSANRSVRYSSTLPSLLIWCMPMKRAMPWATWTT